MDITRRGGAQWEACTARANRRQQADKKTKKRAGADWARRQHATEIEHGVWPKTAISALGGIARGSWAFDSQLIVTFGS